MIYQKIISLYVVFRSPLTVQGVKYIKYVAENAGINMTFRIETGDFDLIYVYVTSEGLYMTLDIIKELANRGYDNVEVVKSDIVTTEKKTGFWVLKNLGD